MKRLYRSRRDKKLFGLCGGLSEMLNVDATLIRILLIVITIFSSGTVIFIYIIAGLVVPKEPPIYNGYGPDGFNGGYGSGYGPGPGSGYGTGYGSQNHHNNTFRTPPRQDQWEGTHSNTSTSSASSSQFDTMMDDLEKKALRREIEELKAKMAKYEKGE